MISYIDVNRTFSELSTDAVVKDDSFEWQSYFGIDQGNNWDNLLQLHRVIILARAGAGKTEEIRRQTERLRRDGRRAYFLRLEQLCVDFETAFEIGTLEEFNEWLETSEPAWFFLDSVDEARLRGPKQFEDAIRRLSVKIAIHRQRSYVYITSRDGVWRPYTDLRFINEKLPYITYGGSEKEFKDTLPDSDEDEIIHSTINTDIPESKLIDPSVFTLDDLNDDQVRKFAVASEVPCLDDFIKAIKVAEAEIYTGRPQDLIELIGYWKKYGKISNHAELIQERTNNRGQTTFS